MRHFQLKSVASLLGALFIVGFSFRNLLKGLSFYDDDSDDGTQGVFRMASRVDKYGIHQYNEANNTGSLLLESAEKALQSLEATSFATAFTTTQSVLEHGFPVSWDHCSLFHTHHSSAPLKLSFLGGSATARPANECNEARYTDAQHQQLEQDLGNASLKFEVLNLAQGATDSLWSSLVLDEVLDAESDVVIWEYAINDVLGASTGRPKRTDGQLAGTNTGHVVVAFVQIL